MKKKSIYMPPMVEIFFMDMENVCGVKASETKGTTDYQDISNIGGNDDDNVAPTSNSIWFDPNENAGDPGVQ